MESLVADIRQSFRLMRRNPDFTAVGVAALALGIGANPGIFSVVDKVLLSPLPYPDPDRLVRLSRKFPNGQGGGSVSIPKYMVWRRNGDDVFSAMTLYDQSGPGLNLGGAGRPRQIKGVHISADYFKVFGVNPMLGRAFTASEDAPHGAKAAIIAEKLWRSYFASDPAVLTRAIMLNGESYPIVGVIADSFLADPDAEVWIPLQADPNSSNQGNYLYAAARLKPGIGIEQARAEMRVAGDAFRRAYPKWMDKTEGVAVTPMRDSIVRDVKPALLILLGAVAFVLLIACANVANLLLARAASRQRELAIRAAVGASRWRVVRQLLTESVILSGLGGLFGFLLGIWGVRGLLLLAPGNIPRLGDAVKAQNLFSLLDWRMGLGTRAGVVVTFSLFGLCPALQISNPDVASTLKEASG